MHSTSPHPIIAPPDAVVGPVHITLFIACYNEADNIVATLDAVAMALMRLGCPFEILVIDDASTDGSPALVRSWRRSRPEIPLRFLINPVNQGLARNFVTAARLGRGTWYKLVCGDNVEPLDTLDCILGSIGAADLLLPYHDTCPGKSRLRVALSRVFTFLVNRLSGHSVRYYNGLPVFRRLDVVHYAPRTSGFGFQAELVTRLLDRRVRYQEVRVEVRERDHGTSSALTWRNFRAVGATLLRIGLRRLWRIARFARFAR